MRKFIGLLVLMASALAIVWLVYQPTMHTDPSPVATLDSGIKQPRISVAQWMEENPDCVHEVPYGFDFEPSSQPTSEACKDRYHHRRMKTRYGANPPYNTNGGWTASSQIYIDGGLGPFVGNLSQLTTTTTVPAVPPSQFYTHFLGDSGPLAQGPFTLASDGGQVYALTFNDWMGVAGYNYYIGTIVGQVLQPVIDCRPTGMASKPLYCRAFIAYCCEATVTTLPVQVNPGDVIAMSVWLDTSLPTHQGTVLTPDAASDPSSSWWYAAFVVNPPDVTHLDFGNNYLHVHDSVGLYSASSYFDITVMELQTIYFDEVGNWYCYQLPNNNSFAYTIQYLGVTTDGVHNTQISPSILVPSMTNQFGPITPLACNWGSYNDGVSTYTLTWNSQGPY